MNIKGKFIQINMPYTDQYIVWIKKTDLPQSEEEIKLLVGKIVDGLELTVVNSIFHSFSPQGATYVTILSQSHLVVHTWPELDILRIDILTCKELNKDSVNNVLARFFPPKSLSISKVSSENNQKT